jgi:ubiquinol-cytochrome c reductase cytochrome c subunit
VRQPALEVGDTWSGRHLAVWLAAPALAAALVVVLAPPAKGRAVTPLVAQAADGQLIYQRDCAVCHGTNGEGTPRGPSLHEIGPAEVHYAVSTGRMPISETGALRRRRPVKYRPEEIQALISHMRPFLAPEPDIPHVDPEAGDLAEGGELYQSECASCHQSAGAGGGLLGREAPSLYDATPLQIAETIRSGPLTMPEYDDKIFNEHQLNSVVRYVRQLKSPENRGGHPIWHLGPLPEGLIVWVAGMGVLIIAVKWIGERH